MPLEAGGNRLDEHLRAATLKLGDRSEAALLAALALEQPLSWIFAHGDEALDPRLVRRFEAFVERRAQGIPFAYIAGKREFYGRDFSVSPSVLVPRPETEHLVEWSLALELPETARVLDVGTGSGCIILSLAAERPHWRCTGTDISKQALAVATINRERLRLPEVRLLHGDMLAPVGEMEFDLIVSNPPYVASDDPHLTEGEISFEPEIALASGPNGLGHIKTLVSSARSVLSGGGWLLIEHGYDQAAAVRELFQLDGYQNIESRRDLAGIERITGGRLGAHSSRSVQGTSE